MVAKAKKQAKDMLSKALPVILIVTGFLGLLSSFMLTVDKINVLKDPNFIPNCNINPIFACSSVMSQPQAEIFGIPNTLVGVITFPVVIAIGAAMYFGASYNRRFWQLFQLGALGGLFGIGYLFFQGVYRIGVVCPWCALTWVAVLALNLYLLVWNWRVGNIPVPRPLAGFNKFLQANHLGVLISIYLVLVVLILNRFWYYFGG
jgi:uncharacterized membrane protein